MLKIIKRKNPQATEEHLHTDEEEFNDNKFDEINALKSLFAIMQSNETVVDAIKRLGAAATRNKIISYFERNIKLIVLFPVINLNNV